MDQRREQFEAEILAIWEQAIRDGARWSDIVDDVDLLMIEAKIDEAINTIDAELGPPLEDIAQGEGNTIRIVRDKDLLRVVSPECTLTYRLRGPNPKVDDAEAMILLCQKSIDRTQDEARKRRRPKGGRPRNTGPTEEQLRKYFADEAKHGTMEAERILAADLECSVRTVRSRIAAIGKN